MDLKELDVLSNKNIGEHWYYWAKARAVLKIIDKQQVTTILDIGAGSGFFSEFLLENSSAQEAWCVDINYEKEYDDYVNNKPIHFRKSVDSVNADIVLLMDVLEHVKDDVALLKEYIPKVPQNSHFLISVPAFKFLWSSHDVFLGHYRRYTLKTCAESINKSGLYLQKSCYFYGLVFPLAASLRLLQKIKTFTPKENKSQLTKHSAISNMLFKFICKIEHSFMLYNKLAGITAFCLAKK